MRWAFCNPESQNLRAKGALVSRAPTFSLCRKHSRTGVPREGA